VQPVGQTYIYTGWIFAIIGYVWIKRLAPERRWLGFWLGAILGLIGLIIAVTVVKQKLTREAVQTPGSALDSVPSPLPDERLAHVERLQVLRTQGALTEDEFIREKQRVLVEAQVAATNHPGPSVRTVWVIAAIALSVIVYFLFPLWVVVAAVALLVGAPLVARRRVPSVSDPRKSG
jgi:cytochrome c-type biogenesis protein CcmH/NrfG